MKRFITAILSMTLLISIIAVPAIAAEKQVINYWSRKNGPDHVVAQEMVDEFNRTHPNIEVKAQFMTWGGSYYAKIRSSILAGNAPDIFDGAAYSPPMFRGNVELFSIADLAKMGIDLADYSQAAWDVVKVNNKYGGVVLAVLPMGMYYNRDLFKKAGLDPDKPPRNYEEFVEYGKKLTKDTNGDGKIDQWGYMIYNGLNPTVWQWESILVQSGYRFLNKDLTKANFNNKAGIDALQKLVDLSRKYKIAPDVPADAMKAFATGKLGMVIAGVWMVSGFRDKVNLSTAAMPVFGTGGPAAWSSEDIFLYPKSRNKERLEAAKVFGGWVAGAKGMEFVQRAYIPTRLANLKSPEMQSRYKKAFAKVVATNGSYFPVLHKGMQEMYGIMWNNLQGAFAGSMTPEQALAKAEKQVNMILSR